jgi:hypothetical protein
MYKFETKQSLSGDGYDQKSGNTLTLSGDNVISGTLKYLTDVTDGFDSRSIINKQYVDDAIALINGVSGGSFTFARNIGGSIGLYDSKVGNTLQFRSLEGTGGTSISRYGDDVLIYSDKIIHNEIPIGEINGINRVFITASPFLSNTISIFLNGIKEKYYTINSDMQITLDDAPKNNGFNDVLEISYVIKIIYN